MSDSPTSGAEEGDRLATVADLLDAFARRTGLGAPDGPSRRYLWTDAHAVCAWLSLHAATGDRAHLDRALALVDEVHRVLGRHREDDARSGWISGLGEEEGAEHPTAGGLRIGKPLPERGRGEAPDPEDEWERDGQYYHYLTRWMHALHRVALVTGEVRHHRQAVELGLATHRGFVRREPGGTRMIWKASIDLSRALVPSMGHHDPLDGWVTLLSLRVLAPTGAEPASPPEVPDPPGVTEPPDAPDPPDVPDPPGGEPLPTLDEAVRELSDICEGRSWATRDPLGIGGLLLDACRLGRLVLDEGVDEEARLRWMCREAWLSLEAFTRTFDATGPAATRLAFRELGLSLGLHAAERLAERVRAAGGTEELSARTEALESYAPLAGSIEGAWLRPGSRDAPTWAGHEDINAVALAVSLAPEGYLGG